MRFWIKPNDKPLTTNLFRLFFAANLVGAVRHADKLFTQSRWTQVDYRGVAKIAAAWMAVMWLMVTFAEWMVSMQNHIPEKHT